MRKCEHGSGRRERCQLPRPQKLPSFTSFGNSATHSHEQRPVIVCLGCCLGKRFQGAFLISYPLTAVQVGKAGFSFE